MLLPARTLIPAITLAALLSCGCSSAPRVYASRAEEVRVPSNGIELAATLCLPAGTPPFPAVVVVHGSGPQRRQPLQDLCDVFTPHQVAVLIYDKRGAGESGGTYSGVGVQNSEAQLNELADDANAAVAFLRKRKDIDGARVGMYGHSQAGWIIPLAATKQDGLAFAVIVSGPSVSVGEEIYYSDLTGEGRKQPSGLLQDEIVRRAAAFAGPHGYDPRPVLARLRVPTLWILGAKDESIPARHCVEVLETLIREKKLPVTLRVYPEGDHALRSAVNGSQLPYWSDIIPWLATKGIAKSKFGR